MEVCGRSVVEDNFKSPLNAVERPTIAKDDMGLILQVPFSHEKVAHGPCYEKVCIRDPTKICLKPDGSLSLATCVGKGGRIDILASFTNMWSGPSLSARILYPKLCQSMMTLLPRNVPTSHTKARVGMLGGFFAISLYHPCAEMERKLTCTSMNSGGQGMHQRRVRSMDHTW